MSIIRQVTWQEFTKILGHDQLQSFASAPLAIVLFLTDWSFPSRLALKRIKKLHFDKRRCGVVDVDLVDSIELIDRYHIKTVPYVIVYKDGEPTQHLSGYRIETLLQLFAPLVAEYALSSPKPQDCPSAHPLEIVSQLPADIYLEGYFYCNRCRKIEKCEPDRPVGHCALCDYDLCNQCLRSDS